MFALSATYRPGVGAGSDPRRVQHGQVVLADPGARATHRRMSRDARAIVGFHRDKDGIWVAELACGHRQHVRHDPPWQSRPWVETEAGRDAHLGKELPCPSCALPALPAGVTMYRQTADFDEHSLPAGLRSRHSLKAGTWGRIVVLKGDCSTPSNGTRSAPSC